MNLEIYGETTEPRPAPIGVVLDQPPMGGGMEEDAQPLSEMARARPGDGQRSWPDLSGIHVLLIDDHIDTRVMVGETLQYCSAIVTTYESADKAMNDLTEIVPNVLICDLSMPGLDGLEFMLRLRGRRPEHGGTVPA